MKVLTNAGEAIRRGTRVGVLKKGPYLAPDVAVQFSHGSIKVSRKSISDYARDLLVEYVRRRGFWYSVEQDGFPVGLAGEIHLFVKPRQAQAIHKELVEAGGVHGWLFWKVVRGFESGKIAPGRATKPCAVADQFFSMLAGGEEEVDELVGEVLGGKTVHSFDEIHDHTQKYHIIEREIIEYRVCRHLDDPLAERRRDRG